MQRIFVKIEGIHCDHCKDKITKSLINDKIKTVKFNRHTAIVYFEGNIDYDEIIDRINNLGYKTDKDKISHIDESKYKLFNFFMITILLISIGVFINKIFGFNIFNFIPSIDSNMGLGMVFIVGLLTSIHCVSMCGAINLFASGGSRYKNSILYNFGRLTSYTLIGGLVGLLGSVLSINRYVQGIIVLFAGIVMLFMALSMLGILNFKNYFPKFKFKAKNSFGIGLLNGLMPCGPLQAMQLYALSTGSFSLGALSLFLFGLGTIPLMFLFGISSNIRSVKWRYIINKISVSLIFILSLFMINRGLFGLGINLNFNDSYKSTTIIDQIQYIDIELSYDNYQDIVVQKDIPVKMIIHVDKSYLTGCNNSLIIGQYDISINLKEGDNEIYFTPDKTGTYNYGCWMNMIKNKIKVIDDINYFERK